MGFTLGRHRETDFYKSADLSSFVALRVKKKTSCLLPMVFSLTREPVRGQLEVKDWRRAEKV